MRWLFDGSLASFGAWRVVTDQVMGGLSTATLTHETLDAEAAAVLRGTVRLDNNGGFVQIALDIALPSRAATRAAEPMPAAGGISIRLWAPAGQAVGIHLRTLDLGAPWQSFRAPLAGSAAWQTVDLPWSAFLPYRTERPLQPSRIQRLGVVVIGASGPALVGVSRLGLGPA